MTEGHSSKFAQGLSVGVVSVALLFLMIAGIINSGLILKEPDICFLLSVGRWIVEHRSLPQTDPFSYGYLLADPGRPYVIYQWLSATLFYLIEKYCTTTGLLVLSAVLTAHAFFVVPSQMLANKVKPTALLGVSFWTLSVVLCRMSIRPELFSYLFSALFLADLLRLYSVRKVDIDWWFVAKCCALATLWVNLHCLFVLLPMILAGCLLLAAIEVAIMQSQGNQTHAFEAKTLALALGGSLLATLLNPYAFSIYPYVMHILADPINDTIRELKPLSIETLKDPFLYPFVAFSAFTAVQCLRLNSFLWQPEGIKKFLKNFQYGHLLFRVLLLVGTFIGYRSVRVVPLATLMAVAGLAYLWKDCSGGLSPFNQAVRRLTVGISWKAKNGLSLLFAIVRWPATCLALAGLGAGLTARIVPPELPQGSAAFHPPFKAIEYFNLPDVRPARLLNDPHYGVVMMWRLGDACPKLFIDARYYMYSKAWIDDYWEMVSAKPKWRELLNQYEIDCIFVKVKAPLVTALEHDAEWSCVYKDEDAVILRRQLKHPG